MARGQVLKPEGTEQGRKGPSSAQSKRGTPIKGLLLSRLATHLHLTQEKSLGQLRASLLWAGCAAARPLLSQLCWFLFPEG